MAHGRGLELAKGTTKKRKSGSPVQKVRPVRRIQRSLKTAEIIARDIVRDIAERRLKAGTALPHETTMMEQYGAGRASIREALRILEAQGLIYLKPGRNGGPVLAETGPEQLGRFLTLFLRLSHATYGDLAEFMLTVSPRLAEAAAANPDRQAVRDSIKLTGRNPCAFTYSTPGNPADLGPHSMINRLAESPVLSMFADAVDAVFNAHTLAITKGEDFLDIAEADHHAIAVAVVEGKADRARQLMKKHIERILEYTRTRAPHIFEQRIEWQ